MEASVSCYTLVPIYQIVCLKTVILINTSSMKIADHIYMLFRYFLSGCFTYFVVGIIDFHVIFVGSH